MDAWMGEGGREEVKREPYYGWQVCVWDGRKGEGEGREGERNLPRLDSSLNFQVSPNSFSFSLVSSSFCYPYHFRSPLLCRCIPFSLLLSPHLRFGEV